MALADRWLLPEGVREALPKEAKAIEQMRRQLLDLFDTWGYELIMPPMLEHLDALLTGVGGELDVNTFKVTDQLSGRMLGVRADITPQAARIDAHCMRSHTVNRLCYCGSVLHARTPEPLASRNPLQIGAELFGHSGMDSDLEVIALMVATLQSASPDLELSLDVGHVKVFTGLVEAIGLSDTDAATYLDMLERKSLPEIGSFVEQLSVPEAHKAWLHALPRLNGGVEALAEAKTVFESAPVSVLEAIDYLTSLASRIAARFPALDLYFDLSELRGYNYHTGVVFAAYSPKHGQAVAKGGRYDKIGKDFGRARPATGFSADLKTLVDLASAQDAAKLLVRAPAGEDSRLQEKIASLRAQGKRVVQTLDGESEQNKCSAELVLQEGEWTLVSL